MSASATDLLTVVLKLLPAFLYVGAGFLAKWAAGVKERLLANTLFYVLIPVIVFKGAFFSDLQSFAWTAVASFAFGCVCAGVGYFMASTFSGMVSTNMLMCLFSCFNIGWFGIPIVLVIFGEEAARVMTALYVGGTLFGNTVGYLLAHEAKASGFAILKKVLSVPAIYGFLAALVAKPFYGSIESILEGDAVTCLFSTFSFLTSLFGMALVGMSMVGMNVAVNIGGIFKLLFARLLATSAVAALFVGASAQLSWGTDLDRRIFGLLPCLPIAANILVFVNRSGSNSSFVGLTLFLSTVLSFCLLLGVFLIRTM